MFSFSQKHKISCILLCILLFLCGSIALADYDTVIDEITNSRKESIYNLELNAPFSKDTSGIREVIDPETGNLSASINLFSLQGRGGVESTSISLTYSTAYASLKEESVEYNGTSYVNALAEKSTFLQSVENFGIGWRLHLPYVEKPDGRNSTVIYVHLADGSVYKKGEDGLEDYKLTDVTFTQRNETRNGVETAYVLRYVTGDTYYFDINGYPVEKTDRLKNRVFYHWSDDTVPKLTSIADDSSDIVYFEYNEGTVTVRHKEKRYILHREAAEEGWLITKVTDPIGRTTQFDYESRSLKFNFWGDPVAGMSNTYYLLKSVSYPTGFVSKYNYITGTKWLYELENGKIEYAKVSERFDADGEERTDYISYTYNKEPDGCPTYKSDKLPAGYIYTTTLTDNYDTKTTYVYDKNHNQIKVSLTADGKLSSEQNRRFDNTTRMPEMFINTLYNKNGESRSVYTESRFDSRGNLIYEDTYENPEHSGKNVKEYAYSNTANLCIYESSFQDEDTKIEIKRTVGYGGGTITAESVYENGRLIKKDTYTYDEYNNLKESQVQNNETDKVITRYWYSAENAFQYPSQMSVSGIKDADGAEDTYTYSYTYDNYGNLTEVVNPDKSRTSYTYDKLNRKTDETLEDGQIRTTVYDDVKNTLLTTDANGYSLLYSYDKYGKLVSVYDKFQLSYLTKREYDAKGRLTKETDSHNTKYVYTYDGLDRVTSIIVYDASGVVLTEQYIQYNTAVNQNGKGYTRLFVEQGAENERRNRVYLFDYLDRQVQETEQYGGAERSQYFEYDLAGNRISYTAKDGAVTKYAYDIFGNVTYALLPDGTENYFEYDYNGNCLNEINGAGEEILYSYDGLNRLTKQETTNGEERSIHRSYYNFRNNLEVSLDAENNKTEYSYNLRGFLTNVRQYSNGTSGQETEYSYDGEGNISSFATGAIGDNNKHIYQYELDTLGRCIKETDPMGSIIQYAYETDGNLSQTIDKNGVVTNYTYDGLGRLIKESNSKGQNLCYTYNGFDEVTEITDGKLTVKNSYNKFGEAVKITRDRNEENFTYDIAGRVTNHTISDLDIGTLTTRYTYDTLGRTTAIETDGGSEYISYDKAGRISEKNYPQTGVKKVYTYYKNSTLKSLLTYVDGKLTTTENIEYDRNGNKTLWEQDGKVTNYTYDGMNRLQGVKESNGVLTEYEFDSFGNISREYTLSSSGIKTTQYEYDRNNRLLISFDDKSSTRYSYDKNGNLINKIYELSGRETESWYSYDGYNRLSEYISGNTSAEYSYNPEGLRESKTVNGKYTRFIYDGANIVGELTNDNYYIYYRGTELLGMNSYDNNSYYYRLDSHGNVTDLLTHTGDEIKTYTYNPYGKEKPFSINPAGNETILYHWKNETENTHNPFRYCGEYYDEESGLIYLRNRYYDPSIGRFISEDLIKDGLNWYAYCGGNPINYVDPWGLSKVWIREWFESKNGKVKPNKKWFGLFGLKSITVSLPGQKSKTYTEGKNGYTIENNFAYIDDSVLNEDFRTDGVYGALIAAYGEHGTSGSLSRQWMKGLYPNYFNADKDYWCITFVSWALEQGGLPSPKTFSVARAIDWYNNNGTYHLTSNGATPKIGDTMFINTSHSGMVIAYDPPWVYTIEGCSEGNKVNVVKRHENTITGYGSNGGDENGAVPDEYDYVRSK